MAQFRPSRRSQGDDDPRRLDHIEDLGNERGRDVLAGGHGLAFLLVDQVVDAGGDPEVFWSEYDQAR